LQPLRLIESRAPGYSPGDLRLEDVALLSIRCALNAWGAPFCETACSSTVRRSLQISGRTGGCGCRVRVAGEAEAGSAGEQPAEEYPAETHSDERLGRGRFLPRRLSGSDHRKRFPDAFENSFLPAANRLSFCPLPDAFRIRRATSRPAPSAAALDCRPVR